MHALVGGGTEFVSLHVVHALRRDGHAVVRLNRGRRGDRTPSGVRTIVADRRDHAALKRALAAERFDAVFDITYAPTTGAEVTALLDALGGGAGHVIFVSTGRVYDHARPVPYDEATPRTAFWGEYAKHKIAGEDVVLDRHRRQGLPITIVRPTHVLGPLNTRNNETFFFDRLLRDRPILVPGHGGWLRQFGHPADLADVMVALVGHPRSVGEAYNVTGEEAMTQVGFVELIAEVVGRRARLVSVDPAWLPEAPPGPVFGQNLVYDCHAVYTTAQLRSELGLRPRFALGSGLVDTYDWYRKEGGDRRAIDFTTEDALLARVGS